MNPQTAQSPYPWHSLPNPEELLSVGPTFHINLNNALPGLLHTRGLHAARKGDVALIGLWNWPGKRQRALMELCLRDTLANKRTFAQHLEESKLSAFAPLTFLSPKQLQYALKGQQSHSKISCLKRSPAGAQSKPVLALMRDRSINDGLWFLKHAGKDNNLGVTCFRGVGTLLKYWISLPEEERLQYVAQAEVRRPLLSPGFFLGEDSSYPRKVTLRAYVLVLATGRCFFHREMLLKVHPNRYDAKDPDPMTHVICHVKYDGVCASRGTEWQHYEEVWPRIGAMMAQCFTAFDFEALQDEAIFGEEELWPWERLGRHIWSSLKSYMKKWVSFPRSVAEARRQKLEEAESMKYALLGLDVIVDEDLRPWCLELNRSPTLSPEARDPEGSKLKAEVVEDFCELLVDPLLNAAVRASRDRPPLSAWSGLQHWAEHKVAKTEQDPRRGFVELPPFEFTACHTHGEITEAIASSLKGGKQRRHTC